MSLTTDKFFYTALKANQQLVTLTKGRIFNTARSSVDEKEDRLPYIIITFDGLVNNGETKDDVEGYTDTVQIGVLVVAHERESLAQLTVLCRQQLQAYYNLCQQDGTTAGADDCPRDWAMSAEGVMYDDLKPCFYQALHYECDTFKDE